MNHNLFLTYNNWYRAQGLRESFKGEYVSLWWEQHLVPLLSRGEVPPKRYWLHQAHRYREIYHRMVHDYRDQFNAMIDSLDHKARMNYHRSVLEIAEVGQVWECTHGRHHLVIDVENGHAVTQSNGLHGFWKWAPNGRLFNGPDYANRLVARVAERIATPDA